MLDAIVIGAGLSGLCAARRLVAAGRTVRVLEARDRVGGRTYNQSVGGHLFDFGGQWVGPTQHRMNALVRETGHTLFPTFDKGRKVMVNRGKRTTYKSTIPSVSPLALVQMELALRRLESLRKTIVLDRPWDHAKAAEYDRTTVEQWKQKHLGHPAARDLVDAAVRVVFGTEPSELSLLYFLQYCNAGGGFKKLVEIPGGAQQDRIVGGTWSLSKHLADALGERVTLDSPVRAIEQHDGAVTVRTDRGDQTARAVIVALAPALASRIAFSPALPSARDRMMQSCVMGSLTKVVTTYERTFWRDAKLSGEALSDSGPIAISFDNTTHDGKYPSIISFVVGPGTTAWSALDPDARKKAVLAQLAVFYGPDGAKVTDYVEKDWGSDPWSRGCPVGVFGAGHAREGMSELRNVCGRVHWAGTETATEWTGYLDGAVQAGERAADEVLARGRT